MSAKLHLSVVLALLLCSVLLYSAVQCFDLSNHHQYGRKIILNNEVIDTESEPQNLNVSSDEAHSDEYDLTQLTQYYVHLKHPVDDNAVKTLEEKYSFTKPQYIPHNTFLVVSTRAKMEEAKSVLSDILWVGNAKKYHGMTDSLKESNPEHRDALEVLLFPSSQSVETISARWQRQLNEQGFHVVLEVISSHKIVAHCLSQDHARLVQWFSSRHLVHHVQEKESFGAMSESDSEDDDPMFLADMDPLSDAYKNLVLSAASVLNSKNENEWIGQPSLPDVQFLWSKGLDGEGEVVGIGDTGLDYDNCFFHDENGTVPFNRVSLDEHRKIACYFTHADNKDVVRGHGSHINSIVAGDSKEQPMFNGVVHKAKICFIDIGLPTKRLDIPHDLSTGYFPLVHKATTISSNSWGNQRHGQYTFAAREIDDYTYRNKDFLVIYAAGNSGRSGGATITPPGTAKNALTVGAAQGTYRGYELGLPLYAQLLKLQMDEQMCGGDASACKASRSTDCCSSEFLSNVCCPKKMLKNLKENPHHFSPENGAVFSSRGPTKDNRLKPDIIAHGQPVFGARSEGTPGQYHCPIPLVMQGTSQAAPIVAGYATMAKQYFKKGYYPSGKPNPNDGFNPSGVLLKATLINSGSSLSGMVDLNGQDKLWAELKPTPSFTQGFGRVNFTNGLPFEGHTHFSFFKEESQVSTKESFSVCFQIDDKPKKEFKTTLVWMDPPGSPRAAITLVNNLDLVVEDAEGNTYHGNGGIDYVNNVEQVYLKPERIAGKTYKIIVKGTHVPQGPQDFALVATGNMKKVPCDKK